MMLIVKHNNGRELVCVTIFNIHSIVWKAVNVSLI